MNLDEARQAFNIECRELLESMEQALLQIERQPADVEAMNALFRAVHTIKGTAGIFGFDIIVGFSHVAENLLDRARGGLLQFDAELASLFLAVRDHLEQLVDLSLEDQAPDAACASRGQALMTRMAAYLGSGDPGPAAKPADPAVPAVDGGSSPAPAADGVASPNWHLTLRFGIDTARCGYDPLSFLAYLGTLGEIVGQTMAIDAIPALSGLDPEACHLALDIALRSDADQATIEGVFEFVREDSLVAVLPPHGSLNAYRQLMARLPEAPATLAQRWIYCGSLEDSEAASLLAPVSTAAEPGTAVDIAPATVVAAADSPLPSPAARDTRNGEGQTLRVDAARLDQLIDLVGELIIAGAGANLVARSHKIKDLVQATSSVTRLMERVRDTALNLRMVPVGGTFGRFQRVVRDVSQELGKDIALKITGGETELDKTVVEKLSDPLTHLVRNAMDHGIESAEQRVAAGKPREGTVHLHAQHEAGHVVVEVSDDGRGLSRQRIVDKALEKGLITDASGLSEAEIFNLVFQPGFSTAEQVSNLSGRGVGMDVVKRSIEALRGRIDLRSTAGEGTRVSIRLPLTLAIIDGFLLGVGKSAYVVPLNTVAECIQLTPAEIGGRDWLDLRGQVLPLVRLRELYAIDGEPAKRQNVVVVQGNGVRAGLVVDQLMGELQTVIKPLGRVFEKVRGVGGFTILGNGDVALLLDVPTLVDQVAQARQAEWHRPAKADHHTLAAAD